MEWHDMGDHITTYFFRITFASEFTFLQRKDRSARICLPEISFAQLGQRWRMPL